MGVAGTGEVAFAKCLQDDTGLTWDACGMARSGLARFADPPPPTSRGRGGCMGVGRGSGGVGPSCTLPCPQDTTEAVSSWASCARRHPFIASLAVCAGGQAARALPR